MKYYKNLAQLQKAGLIQQTQQKIKKADVYNIKTIIYIYYIYRERESWFEVGVSIFLNCYLAAPQPTLGHY